MSEVLNTLVDHFLSINVESEILELENIKNKLISTCTERSIPYAVGEISGGGGGALFAVSQFKQFKEQSEFFMWLGNVSPSFVAIIPKTAKYDEEKRTDGISGLLINAACESGREQELRNQQKIAAGKCITYKIYTLFYGGQIRIDYQISSAVSTLCTTEAVDEYDEVEDGDFLDNVDLMSEEDVRKNALVLANTDGFNITKNQTDRRHLAYKVFGDEIDDYEIENIAKEAGTIYKMEVLPEKIKTLGESGKNAKQISEILGESLAKVRQILASA